ncbi:FecR family protein [Catalinimonas niigatensis]|uniref:FecR family protein n=1 Tax=Catalinimonas niigatensis TaxID=1397264 RepID=UPI0026669264|nr:FecR family protein [Catalinimonas niigatensis]WPP50992.1 DUF4974 domain-containing protein [Catalinimonas niigatensis]
MDRQLLEKFFKGECSGHECNKVLSWYLSGEADQELSEKIETYWKETQRHEKEWGKAFLFESINQQLSTSTKKKTTSLQKKKYKPRQHWKTWSYAAVITLLLGCFAYFYFVLVKASSAPPEAKIADQDVLIIKNTAKGEKLTLVLADSTIVKLNAGSQLSYYKHTPREVFLEGEAFFEVIRDTLHPFQIHSGNILTTVLGTSFNIKAFAEEEIAVSVVSGEVKVAQQDNIAVLDLHLKPGEQAVYSAQDTTFSKNRFDPEDVLSWKEGRLYFKNARFSEVVNALEHWYGVEISVERKGIENGFSGSYTNRSLESVLEGMSFVLNFDYEIHEKHIIIK